MRFLFFRYIGYTRNVSVYLFINKMCFPFYRYIDYTMDASVIQRQDAIDALTYIAGTAVGRRLSWNHISANWQFFMEE